MDSRTLNSTLKAIVLEDVGWGDITMAFTPDKTIRAGVVANENGFVSGLYEAKRLFNLHGIKAKACFKDGDKIRKGNVVLSLSGSSRKIFSTSRSALNIMSRMSGITTLTKKYVDVVKRSNSHARVMATRKTTPLFRYFEKKAVKVGGGLTHRMGLYDMILIKHDHLKMFKDGIPEALNAARKSKLNSKVEIEVETVDYAIKAVESGADIIMLDNVPPKQVKEVIARLTYLGLRKRVKIEVSGGINLANVLRYACLGVDFISIGGLTHSPESLDFNLKVVG